MQIPDTLLYGGLAILAYVLLIWLISLVKKDSSIMDIFWGPGFIVCALVYHLSTDGYIVRDLLILALVGMWGIRLAVHIGRRNHGQPEDFRYAAWRRENGSHWWWFSFFKVFLLQGLIMWIVSLSLFAAQTSTEPAAITWLDYAGALFAGSGFLFELIADRQLSRFKSDPGNKGKLLTGGLWAYSRHPNYFGESVVWWGLFLIALSTGGYYAIVSPLVMTFLLLKVSGVAMLERTMRESKPGYANYVRKTNAFFPWWPKT